MAIANRRHRQCLSSSPLVSLLLVLLLFSLAIIPATSWKAPTTTYKKPQVLAKDCLVAIATINDFLLDPRNTAQGANRQCIGCEPVQTVCPSDPDCQTSIDSMYLNCEGVALPDGYYYDPKWTITGPWDTDVKNKLRIEIERCGCSKAGGTTFGSGMGWYTVKAVVLASAAIAAFS